MNTASYTDTPRVGQRFGSAVVLLTAVIVSGCATTGGVPRPFPVATRTPEATVIPGGEVDLRIGGVVGTALTFLGVPYRNGGTDPSGFDCSGFVQYVFGQYGASLPREVRTQYQHGQAIALDEVQPGDLVFFETVSRGASHVGIAVGSGRFVHAPSSRGVIRVEPYTASYWARRFVGARRLGDSPELAPKGLPGAVRTSQ